MVVTELGIVKVPVKSVQLTKAPTPIVVTVFGIVNTPAFLKLEPTRYVRVRSLYKIPSDISQLVPI